MIVLLCIVIVTVFYVALSVASCQHMSPLHCILPQANGARDALAKALYVRTLVAIVRRINNLLRPLPQFSPHSAQSAPHLFGGGVSHADAPGHGFGSPTMLEPPHLQVSQGQCSLRTLDPKGTPWRPGHLFTTLTMIRCMHYKHL